MHMILMDILLLCILGWVILIVASWIAGAAFSKQVWPAALLMMVTACVVYGPDDLKYGATWAMVFLTAYFFLKGIVTFMRDLNGQD